jgi:Zn-dependent protease with chaperone function
MLFRASRKTQPVDTFAFPSGPDFVPDGLTAPTPGYRRNATFAMLSLGGFMLFYLALMIWFGWSAWVIFRDMAAMPDLNIMLGVAGASSAFLAIFMAKGLLFIQRSEGPRDYELKRADHPRVFRFLNAIAEEAGAPKPHRVFLSPRVNASVSYDLSLLNLILPARKNLEIGLGLVNVLSLGELKAVLAHEFGHFAQKTMAVGRWVYIAQQVATQIVNRRDALDTFLAGLGRFDLRVAWIGWTLQFVVWSLRSLIDTLLMGVILAQRALSREMEFQADLVSVQLCGSDALINALHKLSGADDAMQRATNFAVNEKLAGKPVADVFVVQSRVLEHLRDIYADPHYGADPAAPAGPPNAHRVFKSSIAAPPRMWATHPANTDREDNAKFNYVPCQVDSRSAWELFPDAATLRIDVTSHMLKDVTAAAPTEGAAQFAPMEESLARLDENYTHILVNPRYRGAYLGRPVARDFKAVQDMYAPPGDTKDLQTAIASLYAPAFGDALEKLRELHEEKFNFEGLRKGYLKAPSGVVRWRGNEVAPRELPRILKSLEEEIAPLEDETRNHARRVRGLHLAAATKLGRGWDQYLLGLASLIHYLEHTTADLLDLDGVLQNVFAVVMADGTVSKKELKRLIAASNDLHAGLSGIYATAGDVHLDERTAARTDIHDFSAALGPFTLVAADQQNIGAWLNAISGWTSATTGLLNACRNAALQELLLCEDEVAAMLSLEGAIPHAPAPAATPATYPRLMTTESRPRQTKLRWWDRFQTADGWIAATARTIVALTVVGSVIALGIVLTVPEAARAFDQPLEPQPWTVDEPSMSQPEAPPTLETLPPPTLEAAPMEEPAAPVESAPVEPEAAPAESSPAPEEMSAPVPVETTEPDAIPIAAPEAPQ